MSLTGTFRWLNVTGTLRPKMNKQASAQMALRRTDQFMLLPSSKITAMSGPSRGKKNNPFCSRQRGTCCFTLFGVSPLYNGSDMENYSRCRRPIGAETGEKSLTTKQHEERARNQFNLFRALSCGFVVKLFLSSLSA